jgi:hypothetical protein
MWNGRRSHKPVAKRRGHRGRHDRSFPGHFLADLTPQFPVTFSFALAEREHRMKFTATMWTCVLCLSCAASADPLNCSGGPAPACPPLQKLFGACAAQAAAEVTCRTEEKRFVGAARKGKTVYAYYEPPAGYAFDPASARGIVSDGRGTHGVDASITDDKRLYCLWGAAGNGSYNAGYCEVKARQVETAR